MLGWTLPFIMYVVYVPMWTRHNTILLPSLPVGSFSTSPAFFISHYCHACHSCARTFNFSALLQVRRGEPNARNEIRGSFARASSCRGCITRVKLLPLPQPPVRVRTDARTNPSAQRAIQLRSVLARVYDVSIQNQITTTVP
jgi:hypothetical protein